ncbi:cytochrome P450 [Actinomadura sp. 9N407]|uniref:cytochrome P450 n=1 Tax=Actinomadura sp. 9N407 TaxID=3375154 RepID=UPI0037B72544
MPAVPAVPEIDLTDPEVIRDPFTAYGTARESAPVARVTAPGMPPMWTLTRHEDARAMLADPRFAVTSGSFMRPDVPADCLPYMRTMSEMNGTEHARLRKLAAPAFTARRAAAFRPRIQPLVDRLLDELPGHADGGVVDLMEHFTRPLPMDVICELVGIPEADRLRWREYGATVAGASGQAFADAIPGIMNGAKEAVARRRAEPADDLISDLLSTQAEDGDRISVTGPGDTGLTDTALTDTALTDTVLTDTGLTDTEIVTLIWHLVMAGQTPTNLIANAVEALLSHPGRLAALRADPALMPRAVEELLRWCGPALLAIPRYALEDTELFGVPVRKGEAVTVSIAAANRDPRAFTDPDRFDVTRAAGTAGHLGFAHGPHFCLGASLARVETEVALATLLRRFPDLAFADPAGAQRAPDPGTWRLVSLPVTLKPGRSRA